MENLPIHISPYLSALIKDIQLLESACSFVCLSVTKKDNIIDISIWAPRSLLVKHTDDNKAIKKLNRKRDERKAQKVEEKKRQEAHNKRMAELRMQVHVDVWPAGFE